MPRVDPSTVPTMQRALEVWGAGEGAQAEPVPRARLPLGSTGARGCLLPGACRWVCTGSAVAPLQCCVLGGFRGAEQHQAEPMHCKGTRCFMPSLSLERPGVLPASVSLPAGGAERFLLLAWACSGRAGHRHNMCKRLLPTVRKDSEPGTEAAVCPSPPLLSVGYADGVGLLSL